ncbi:DUF397 domain-containing protein [Streptomyces mirabilis]|uniref:DUF397 domain-containing protein n=1 Tax=Streptomyces mirabilis TaxID=68239 RepID=UPI0036694232
MIQWLKSTFSSGSDGSNCVELAHHDGSLLLRESDEPDRILSLSIIGLAALRQGVQAGGRVRR